MSIQELTSVPIAITVAEMMSAVGLDLVVSFLRSTGQNSYGETA